jgi:hypothetical protein
MGPPTSMRGVTVRLENGDKVLVSSDSTRIFLQLRHGTPTNRTCRSRHPYPVFRNGPQGCLTHLVRIPCKKVVSWAGREEQKMQVVETLAGKGVSTEGDPLALAAMIT